MPTREGTITLVLAVAIFLLATNVMSGLLFALDAVLVAVFIVGAATAYGPMRRLSVTRRLPPRAVEGKALKIETTLASRRRGRLVTVEEGWRGTRARATVTHLTPGEPVTTTVTLLPRRRGHYALDATEITSRGAVSLFAARRRIAARERITIWPRTHPVPPEILAGLTSAPDGRATGERTRAAEDLYGVRDYQRGDAPSHIHWPLTLRRGALVVREYERPRSVRLAIVLDLDRRQSLERLDGAVRAAASILQAAAAAGADVVTEAWNGDRVEQRGLESAMNWLAGVEPSGPPLAQALPRLRERSDRHLVVVASSAALPPLPRDATAVLPAEDHPGRAGFVYTSDGAVAAW